MDGLVQVEVGKFPPAVLFRCLVMGAVAGAATAQVISLDRSLAAGLVACVVAAWPAWPRARKQLAAACGLALMLLRAAFAPMPLPEAAFTGPKEFKAVVAEAPRLAESVTRYRVAPEGMAGAPLILTARPWPSFAYGDTIHVSCRNVAEVEFAGYLRQGIVRECAFPEITLVQAAPPSLRAWLLRLRESAGGKLKQFTPEPFGTLATGMLWGDDGGLPKDLTEDFRRTGTTHLLAVSGYNVMVLTEMLFWLLIGVGLWRKSATWVVLAVLPMFVVFTGAEPAVTRASIMAAMLLLGRLASRVADKINLLLGTAAAMLLFRPALFVDLGFQLSFAAMAGVLFISPWVSKKARFMPESLGIREAASQTVAATIATLPVIWLGVGTVSLVSPFANVLVAPTIPLVYGFGLVTLALSWLPLVGQVTGWFLVLVLTYVTYATHWLAALPWASVSTTAWWSALLMSAGSIWLWRELRHRV